MDIGFVEGVVKDTSDPQEMGRVKVWCPAVDGEGFKVENLPWAYYVSPLAGQVYDYPAGPAGMETPGPTSYGFWAIPKVGASVIVGFLYGDRNQRFYLGSYFPDHGNRSLPAGRNTATGPQSDSYETMNPATTSLGAQFQGNLAASEAQTRGAYERQVAQAATEKTVAEGYQKDVKGVGLDPQTYCITTPGRHSIIMQDNIENGRVRIKTAEGHQVILDDANERIYVSTAKGQTWIELDQDGRIHVYAGSDISMTTGGNFNLSAKGNVRIAAGGDVDIGASGHARISACSDLSLSGDAGLYATSGAGMELLAAGGTNISAGSGLNILAGGTILQTGSAIHLNGPGASKAATAPCATAPDVLPEHEPWVRAGSKAKRNKNWKP
jgi:phage gp45-like